MDDATSLQTVCLRCKRGNSTIRKVRRRKGGCVRNLVLMVYASLPATSKHKAKFVLVTDGRVVHAEKLGSDEPPLACEYVSPAGLKIVSAFGLGNEEVHE